MQGEGGRGNKGIQVKGSQRCGDTQLPHVNEDQRRSIADAGLSQPGPG